MKKHYFRSAVAALLPLLLIAQPVEACTVHHREETDCRWFDLGRAYRKIQNPTIIKILWSESVSTIKKEPFLKMLPTVFNIPCQRLAISIQRFQMSPLIRIFDEAGFNEYGVSISATVSASANDKIQKVDPYVKDGLAESGLTQYRSPQCENRKRRG